MSDLVGQTLLGKYRIEALVGRGGMAEVYKAWDMRRQYYVAIKVMREDLAEDIEFLRHFKQEANALAALSHTNIVRFYSFEREGRLAFIVMDHVDGTTLRGRILDAGGHPLPLNEVASIARQVCSALHYAHGEGLIHRDVKPGNIMLQPDGRVLLTDFGIAKAADAATMTTVIPGTVAYMSPEQCKSERLDARTDIYSLGIVAYEMLTGRRPFAGESKEVGEGSTRDRILWEQVHASPLPLRRFNPQVPIEAERVLLKALAKNREERWSSASAFCEALGAVIGVGASETPAKQIGPLPPSFPPQLQERPAGKRKQATSNEGDALRPDRISLPLPPRGIAVVTAGVLVVLALVLALALGRRPASNFQSALHETQADTQLTAQTSPPPFPTVTGTPVSGTAVTPISVPSSTTTILSIPTPVPTTTSVATPSSTPSRTPSPTVTPTQSPTMTPTESGPIAVFADDFNGVSLNTSNWVLDQGTGSATVINGVLRMASSRSRYPYIYSQGNPFPANGDFQMRFRFRYSEVKLCGVGVIMTSYLVPPGLTQNEAANRQRTAEANGVQIGVWQDISNGLQLWFRSGADRADVPFPGPNSNWNEMTIKYLGGQYMLYLNGRLTYTSQKSTFRPRYIWIGHPADLGADCQWDTLEVDYIRVESLP